MISTAFGPYTPIETPLTSAISNITPTITPIVVIAAPNETIAKLLQRDLVVWIIPDGKILEVHTVVAKKATQHIIMATILAAQGCDPRDIESQIPNIQLGWPST